MAVPQAHRSHAAYRGGIVAHSPRAVDAGLTWLVYAGLAVVLLGEGIRFWGAPHRRHLADPQRAPGSAD